MATVRGHAVAWSTTAGNKSAAAATVLNDLIIVLCAATGTNGTNADTTAVSDNNADGLGTYTKVTGGDSGSASPRTEVFIRNNLVGSATSTTVSATQANSNGGGFNALRVTGMTNVGTAAIRQIAFAAFGAGATPSVTLTSAALTGNSLCGMVVNGNTGAAGTTATEPTGWTEIQDLVYSTPSTGLETARLDSGFTGTTVSWGATSATAGIALVVEFDTSSATPQTVTASLIDQTGVTFAPSVNLSVSVGLISQAGTTFAPVVNQAAGPQTVTPGLINQAGTAFAPQVNLQVQGSFINQTGVTFAPKVNLSVTAPLINQAGAVFSPQVNTSVQAALISRVGTTFAPQVNQQVQIPLIDKSGSTFAPSVSGGGLSVSAPLIAMLEGGYPEGYGGIGYAIFPPNPQITQTVTASLINQAGTVFAPKLNLSVFPGLIANFDGFSDTFSDTYGGGGAYDILTPKVNEAVSFPLISNIGSVFAAGVQLQVQVPLIDRSGTIFTPQVKEPQTVNAPLISQTGTTFAPLVNEAGAAQSVLAPLISSTPTAFAPSVKEQVQLGLISQTPVLFAPKLNQAISLSLISQIGVLFSPAVLQGTFGAPVDDPQARDLASVGAATLGLAEGEAVDVSQSG
jgi:hypothetical protein